MAMILSGHPSSPANPGIDENGPPTPGSMFADAGTQTGFVPKESGEPGSSSTDAETLVKALRNVISTLIRPSDGEDKYDANRNALGPDGEQFVIALQKFLSSSLCSQRGSVGGIEVELEEKVSDIPTAESRATSCDDKDVADTALEEKETDIPTIGSQATLHDDLSAKDVADTALEEELAPDSSAFEENPSQERLTLMKEPSDRTMISIERSPSILHPDAFEQRKSSLIDKALNALRAHVFNTMPIRLLYFKPLRSKLQITLIERGDIFAHIASMLVRGIDFPSVFEKIADLESRLEILRRRFFSGDAVQTDNARVDSSAEEAEQMVLEGLIDKYAKYAILSHTWLSGNAREVTYGNWIRSDFDPQQLGYRKLVNFCRTVWKDYGVAFGWMDTICINKESSAELDESIRSMYKWYQRADVCITYLADTMTLSDMPQDNWFTRGWTLQELLAPAHVKFYNTEWDKLVESLESDKDNAIITTRIEEATAITADELRQRPSDIPISRRMQMAAKRQVTREEDTAYSLMGFLDVSIATAYGEGAERAFSRLLQAVLNATSEGIEDIFNWAGPRHSQLSTLLPSSIQSYLDRASSVPNRERHFGPVEPIMLTHVGLRITILLMPAIPLEHPNPFPLRLGDYHAIADISYHPELAIFLDDTDVVSGSYSVLDARTDQISDNNTWYNPTQLALGVLNIEGRDNECIGVPHHCLAVAMTSDFSILQKVATKAPVTFHLHNIRDADTSSDDYYLIERRELESHGMKLDTLIL